MAKIKITSNTENKKVSIKVSKKLKEELKKVKKNILNVDNLTAKAFDTNVSMVALSFVSELNKVDNVNIRTNIFSSINENNEYELHLEIIGNKKELKEVLKYTSEFIYETLNGHNENEGESCNENYNEDESESYDEDYGENESDNEDCDNNCQAEEQQKLFNAKKDFILQTISQALDSVSIKELNEKGSIVINFN